MSMSGVGYLCSVLYHPPKKEDAKFMDFFNEYIDEISSFNGTNIIFGDFNFDLLGDTFYSNRINNIIYTKGFTQIVKTPTRIVPRSQTLIDFIVTDDKNLAHKVHLTPKISDHSILSISINQQRSVDIISHQRSFKDYKCDQLQKELLEINWNKDNSDVNLLADSFITDIKTVLDRMCPEVRIIQKTKICG